MPSARWMAKEAFPATQGDGQIGLLHLTIGESLAEHGEGGNLRSAKKNGFILSGQLIRDHLHSLEMSKVQN